MSKVQAPQLSDILAARERIAPYIRRTPLVELDLGLSDRRIFLKKEEECLAACTGAPMMMVDHVFHEHLTPEKLDEILGDLK